MSLRAPSVTQRPHRNARQWLTTWSLLLRAAVALDDIAVDFDLAVNHQSMQEMETHQVARYCDYLQKPTAFGKAGQML